MVDNIFSTILISVAKLISLLESFVDSQGINISNWVTQLIANNPVEYDTSLMVKVNDKVKTINLKSGYIPQPVKREANNYVGHLRNASVKNPELEVMLLLAYQSACLILGKNAAIVPCGRGLMIDAILKESPYTDVVLTIHGYSSGGKDKPHDITFSLDELKSLSKFWVIRSKRITSLAKRTGKTSTSDTLPNRDNIEIIE
jgi:hypothetical protein